MPPLAGVAAKLVAPMVVNIATGLIRNVAGQALRNLPLIGDTFQKIAGGIGQIFGGAVAQGIGQLGRLLAPRGMFPPLPLPGLPGFPGGRPFNPRLWFGPRHVHVHININVTINNLQRILQPGSQLFQKLNQVLGRLDSILDALRRVLDRLGLQPPPFRRLYGPPTPIIGGPPGGVSGPGGGAIDRLFGEMDKIMNELNSGKELKPQDVMRLQARMLQIQQMIQMINEMRKAMHDMSMSIIRNIR